MMRLIIISGRSGSGKSSALDVLEDNGFHCVDNFPAVLLIDLCSKFFLNNPDKNQFWAVSVDARTQPEQLLSFPHILSDVRKMGIQCDLIFLDAADDIILQRFSETRRRHPLTNDALSLIEAIHAESQYLMGMASEADLRIDTSHLSINDLKSQIKSRILNKKGTDTDFLIESFGFKNGVATDADFVFDVRCVTNPHWTISLRHLTGLDEEVICFLDEQKDMQDMYQDILTFLQKWLPRFSENNRAYVTVAIGCTGGQHRSVYLVEKLGNSLSRVLSTLQIRHRDLHLHEHT